MYVCMYVCMYIYIYIHSRELTWHVPSMVQETHLSNYHFDDIACFSLVGSCKLRKRSSNRLMAYCHEHQPGDTPPFREKRYQDSQDHSTKKETKQVDFGAADKIANDKRRGDNYSALKVKYMYYIDIRLRIVCKIYKISIYSVCVLYIYICR